MENTPSPFRPTPRKETLPQRLLSELRKTPSDMVMRVHHNDGISYEVLGKSPKDREAEPIMTADSAAVYIGKFEPPPFVEHLPNHTFGFQTPGRIYDDQFIKTFLDYGFRHTPPGEKVKVILCPSLSELLNGPDDTKTAYTLNEEARRIHMIAALSFTKRLQDLELVAMEQIPDNVALFQRLEACKNAKGEVDIDQAYGSPEIKLSPESTALEIAQFLYQAAQKNDKLREIFFKMRPAKVRDMAYPESSKYYGLTEIAIRLKAILSGQKLHIGAERQDVYDKHIVSIVRGRNQNGHFKNFVELYPLYELFSGKTFETVHISTKANAFKKKEDKKLAWNRFFVFGAVLNCLALGGLLEYRKLQHAEKAPVTQSTTERPTPSQTSPSEADKTPDAGSELQ